MLRFASTDSHPEAFDELEHGLDMLEALPAIAVEPFALRTIWRLVSVLGFEPALTECVRDGGALAETGPIAFSTSDGGALCERCAVEHGATRLPGEARVQLEALLDPAAELPDLDGPHLAAHRRLLVRFIRYHLADGAELPALAFWQDRPWEAVATR